MSLLLAQLDMVNKVVHTLPPFSSSQSFIFNTLAASESASFSVSPGAMAAKTSTPFPIEETSWESTVTDAESTRWRMATHEISIWVI